jgi:hypothetical protein
MYNIPAFDPASYCRADYYSMLLMEVFFTFAVVREAQREIIRIIQTMQDDIKLRGKYIFNIIEQNKN